jgi:hypothetical protein
MTDVEREIERLVSGHALIDTPSAMRALARLARTGGKEE